MLQTNKKRMSTEKLALMALLTAITAVLAYFGGFVKIGALASISLTLIPIVIGAALCGPFSGAWFGLVSAVVFFTTADALFWFTLSIPGTVITVVAKGMLSGLCAGLVYKLVAGFNKYCAVLISAIVCPVVNTGVFLLGCFLFFFDTIKSGAAEKGISVFIFIVTVYIGFNFVFELLANIVLSPAILRILNIKKKS